MTRLDGEKLRGVLEKRKGILEELGKNPKTKPELSENLSIPRSTIDRAISELEGVECVQRERRKYCPTLCAELALQEYRHYVETTNDVLNAMPILADLSEDVPIDIALIHGADVRTAEPCAPESALTPSVELLHGASKLYGLVPVALTMHFETLHERIVEDNLYAEIVIIPQMRESLSKLLPRELNDLLSTGSFNIYESERGVPYSLWILEMDNNSSHVALTVYNDCAIRGLIMNDSMEAVKWGREIYEEYQSTARKLTRDDFVY